MNLTDFERGKRDARDFANRLACDSDIVEFGMDPLLDVTGSDEYLDGYAQAAELAGDAAYRRLTA